VWKLLKNSSLEFGEVVIAENHLVIIRVIIGHESLLTEDERGVGDGSVFLLEREAAGGGVILHDGVGVASGRVDDLSLDLLANVFDPLLGGQLGLLVLRDVAHKGDRDLLGGGDQHLADVASSTTTLF